jgi:hypothetical protein
MPGMTKRNRGSNLKKLARMVPLANMNMSARRWVHEKVG